MSITVVSPGFLTTVQDLGRHHCAHWGVSPSGAADTVSLRLGNLLVSNPPNAAALEMTLVGGSFQFESPRVIALTGSDFGATIDGLQIPLWQTISVKADQVLQFGQTKSGARCYLCVAGGIAVPPILSSSSTHLLTGLGGFNGRALKTGDRLSCADREGNSPAKRQIVKKQVLELLFAVGSIGITTGPQSNFFVPDAQSRFCSSVYVVKEESNRMGLRLSGPNLDRATQEDMTTEGVSLGAIQVPPDGEPIILFVEHPTTGGYPKIANVISADLHRVGQLRPRDKIHFELLTSEKALARLSEREGLLTPQQCLQLL
jgi:antagonist of KipI